ncbi:DUF4886 domain-containing protein [Maribacter halichondriae]|uniref:DUF4886 domain-containing protein n=1 Tax=Maribacter halichondriae TaxID=2980554 RepID=UPI002358F2B2|nr:DUF4886 domain-containing protein [Maribacter sp. Hal144]
MVEDFKHNGFPWLRFMNFFFVGAIRFSVLVLFLVSGCSKSEKSDTAQEVENSKSVSDIEVLFIGNSHTYYNSGVPFHMGRFREQENLPYSPFIAESSFGGFSLTDHLSNAATLEKINEREWEYIVLQENTFVAANDGQSTLIALKSFKELLSQKSTKIYLFMTWEYQGEPQMYEQIKKTYEDGAIEASAEIVRVGKVWREIMQDSLPNIDLYNGDGYHPGPQGTFLAAAMFYSKIYKKNPSDNPYKAGLETEVADYLKLQAN